MTEPKSAEPSMDEILASIRRIITEDELPPAPVGDADDSDVLILTERAPPDPAPPEPRHPEPAVSKPPSAAKAEPLVGDTAAEAAASSFDSLSSAIETTATPSPAMPMAGRTLEDVTRELLAPLLKTWLEQNLPAIVRERVDEEVARIARLRVRPAP